MRIAICDDIIQICNELESMIIKYYKKIDQVLEIDVYINVEKFISQLDDGVMYDLIFLDIELGNMTGIDVGEIIRYKLEDYITKIVYISAKNQYDRQLFHIQPFDFLAKPFNEKEVENILDHAMKVIRIGKSVFAFQKSGQQIMLPLNDILYFEALDREIRVVCSKNEYLFYGKFSIVFDELSNKGFIQPHRSYIVNYEFINSLESNQIIMSNNDIIPVSRRKYKEVKQYHIDYLRGNNNAII